MFKGYRICLGIIISIVMAGCTNRINQANSLTTSQQCQLIQHKLGKAEICNQPQKVVALNPKMLDILLSLDVQPIGFADVFSVHRGHYNNPSQQIPYLGRKVTTQPVNLGTSFQLSLERVVKLKPDLILGDVRANSKEYNILSHVAPTLVFGYIGDDKWQDIILDIAKIFGRTQKAQQVIENYQQQLKDARKALAPVAAKYPKVLMLSSEQLNRNIRVVNNTDFCGAIVEDLGFKLVSLGKQKQQSVNQEASIELLPTLDTDIIIIQAHNIGAFTQLTNANQLESNQLEPLKQQWYKSPIAQSLEASQKNRVYFVPSYLCLGLPSPIGAEVFINSLRHKLLPNAQSSYNY